MNFHMNGMKKTMVKLHGMLKIAEESIKKNPSHVMMVQKENKKRKFKGKAGALDAISNSKSKPARKSKLGSVGTDICHHCHNPDHWERNCKLYLAEQKKKKGSVSPVSGAE
ncbi:hypothetical protein GUJ93_ZPchr0004g38511 [Zizania palustris]|uniref:Uncharacterized protein n=1 Tax=Zizania palustris TaxID=103762 RepID=A0A8J5V8U1_ZIZPA|nr:hypothetical protein GUJ93_ZPchr0004g38511 [Zizania palustris]